MQTLRVFPTRTSYTPTDSMVWIGKPKFKVLIPPHDEVHISCIFTWDKEKCLEIADAWRQATRKPVKIGGPAFGSPATDFTQGMYLKSNVIFTTRGCNNNCPWCCVPRLEGKLSELPICVGNVIQDNNFLQANKTHQQKVFNMLKSQMGGLF